MAPRWIDGLADVLATTDAPCFVLSEALAEQVTGFHVHRGALASLERRPLPPVADVLAGARSVLVLEDIVDHTNVGAILRSGRGPRLRRGAALAALRRPALPPRDQGRDGRGVHDAVDPPARLVRRPAGPLGRRLHHRRADPGPGLHADRGGRGRRRPARAGARAPRATGSRRAGSSRPTGGRSSRCARASTRSTWPPRPRSPATSPPAADRALRARSDVPTRALACALGGADRALASRREAPSGHLRRAGRRRAGTCVALGGAERALASRWEASTGHSRRAGRRPSGHLRRAGRRSTDVGDGPADRAPASDEVAARSVGRTPATSDEAADAGTGRGVGDEG